MSFTLASCLSLYFTTVLLYLSSSAFCPVGQIWDQKPYHLPGLDVMICDVCITPVHSAVAPSFSLPVSALHHPTPVLMWLLAGWQTGCVSIMVHCSPPGCHHSLCPGSVHHAADSAYLQGAREAELLSLVGIR